MWSVTMLWSLCERRWFSLFNYEMSIKLSQKNITKTIHKLSRMLPIFSLNKNSLCEPCSSLNTPVHYLFREQYKISGSESFTRWLVWPPRPWGLRQPWEPSAALKAFGTSIWLRDLCPPHTLHFRLGFRVPITCDEKKVQWQQTVVKGGQRGQIGQGDEGGKGHFTLGFRVPTTCDEKKFDDNR